MDKKLIIKSARVAIKSEISGIKKLSTVIDDNFSKILIKLSKVKGKIIFTGVGKSAHIAQKISSTMSSTGTPSQFYHSTEMSHGDLGAISKNDLIIIFSLSGIPIGIVSNQDSQSIGSSEGMTVSDEPPWGRRLPID